MQTSDTVKGMQQYIMPMSYSYTTLTPMQMRDKINGIQQNKAHVMVAGTSQETKSGSTFYVGNLLSGQSDPIEQRRAAAKKQAYQVIRDTFTSQQKIENDLQGREDHAKTLREQKGEAKRQIMLLDQQKEELTKEYGASKDGYVRGTASDAEYQERMKELESYKMPYERAIRICDYGYKDQAGIREEYAVVRGTQLERLKKEPMLEASQEAEDILAAASEEIIGMLTEEAKDHIEEQQQKEQEKAEERKEEKRQEQEKIEEVRARREELEELLYPEQAEKKKDRPESSEVLSGDILTESLLKMDVLQTGIRQELEGITQKMNLVAEDLKGIRVDESL